VWVGFDPPPAAKLAAEAYVLAVADPASHGTRWVISLDDSVARRSDGEEATGRGYVEETPRHGGLLRAAQRDQDLPAERPPGGDVGFCRAQLGYRRGRDQLASTAAPAVPADPRSRAAGASFAGLQAIFYIDKEAPDAALRKKLLAFASGGGILFVAFQVAQPRGSAGRG